MTFTVGRPPSLPTVVFQLRGVRIYSRIAMAFHKHNIDTMVFGDLVAVDGRVVIDVGSGAGSFVAWLRQQGASAYGLECSMNMLNQAGQLNGGSSQVGGVGERLPFATGSIDVVTFINSLHHVPSPSITDALREAARVVGSDGFVYVLEPVAAGPGYETSKLIDDEAEVRAKAQEAMDRMNGSTLLQIDEGRYLNRYTYSSVDDYFDVMIGVDASRAAQVEQHRAAVTEAFNRNGTATSDGTTFEHPMHYRLFTVV